MDAGGADRDVLSGGHFDIWMGRNQSKTFTIRVSSSYSSGSIKVQLDKSYLYKNSDDAYAAKRSDSPVYDFTSNIISITVNPSL